MEERRHYRSIYWPLLLIAVGAVLVLNNLGIIPGDMWSLFLRLWPLLFIVGGIDNLFQREGLAGPLLMIGLGTLFLMGNFGMLTMGAFELLIRLWPVFLIALGLDVLFRGASPWAALVGAVLAVALVAGIFWYATTGQALAPAQVESINQPLDGAREAEVRVNPVVGELRINAGSGESLAEGELALARGQSVEQDYQVEDGVGRYNLQGQGEVVYITGVGQDMNWDLSLNPDVAMELKTQMAVGKQELDLSGLQVSDLTAETALGMISLVVPDQLPFEGRVKSAIGSIVIRVPRGASVLIRLDGGMTGVDLPDGFTRDDNRITSEGVEGDDADIILFVEQPIGSVRVEYSN